jgi:3-oxoacyl-[acyl-carrier protein] reductase
VITFIAGRSQDGGPSPAVRAGLGTPIAERFIAEGAQVVCGDLDIAATEAAAKELGPDALAVKCDVTRPKMSMRCSPQLSSTSAASTSWSTTPGITRDATMRKMTESSSTRSSPSI